MAGPFILTLLGDLDRHVHHFDLDRSGLGEKAMDIAAGAMLRDMDRETDPDGNAWPPLSDDYAEWKQRAVGGEPMAVLHKVMKSLDQLKGERHVSATEAEMTFGTDEQARREAAWFQEGDANQPPRPFWGFSAECIAELDELFERHLGTI